MMMAENPKITVEVESKGTQSVKSQVNDLKKALDVLIGNTALTNLRLQKLTETSRGTGKAIKEVKQEFYKITESIKKAKKEIDLLGKVTSQLKQAIVGIISLQTALYIVRTADSMKLLEARTINASKSVALGVENFKQLKKQATDAGVALEGTVRLFQRLSNTKNSIGATNAEILKLTDTVSKLGVISGASPEAIKYSMLQFSQAMAGGIVRAEEFNSVLENTPELAVKIAEGLGISVGQLRKMVIEGQLLSKDVFNVLLKQAGKVNKEFDSMPMTFGRLKAQADIALGSIIADIDKATGASSFWVKQLQRALGWIEKNREAIIFLTKATAYGFKSVIDIVQMAWRGFQGVINSIVETSLRAVQKLATAFNSISPIKFQSTGVLEGMIQSSKASRKANFGGAGQDFNQIVKGFANLSSPLTPVSMPVPRDIRGGIDPVTGSKGKKKKSAGESEAEKEAKRYAEALQGLKDKARDASMELAGMRSAQQALTIGGITAYENQLLQNEGMKQFVELMGDYYGKGKKNLELIAQKIVADNKAIELQKKTLEYNVKMKQLQMDLNFEEEKNKQLRDAFLAGGEKALELKRRELEIETRKRDLLKESGLNTADAEAQAKAQAESEARVATQKTELDTMVENSRRASEDIRSALTTAWDNTVTQMINGTASFKEIMVGLLRQVAVALIKVYTLQLITGFVGSHMTGGANASDFGGKFAGKFDQIGKSLNVDVISAKATPARAGGGAVSAGVPYMVGESGRELFVPRTSGNIMPSHAVKNPSSGGSVTIVNNMTINTQGGKDDGKDVLQAGKELMQAMEVKIRKVLQDEMRQGGMLQRGFA